MTAWTGVYRCVECHHGRHLTACAALIASGPIGADGELTEHNGIYEVELHEDSIECGKHPGATIERRIDGVWHRWWSCPNCDGSGKRGQWRQYPCPSDEFRHRTHKGWRPVRDLAAEQRAALTGSPQRSQPSR